MFRLLISCAFCVSVASAGDINQVPGTCQAGDHCSPDHARQVAAEVAASESEKQAIEFVQINTQMSFKQSRAEQDQDADPVTKTTSTWNPEPKTGAEASGVSMNCDDDWEAFIAALISNVVMILVCMGFFMAAKKMYPMVYANNTLNGVQPYPVPEGALGWARAALGISVQEITDSVGLDQAMLMEYAQMNMRILAMFGLPMFCIMGPVHMMFGGTAAGKDYLSYFSFGNVENGSWIYNIHGFTVWFVVITVQANIYWTMEKYLERRIEWLEKLPMTRATTILVEGVPEEYQTDSRLKDFFAKLFGASKVKSAYLAKRAPMLKYQIQRKADSASALDAAKFKWEKVGNAPDQRPKSFRGVDLIEFYEKEIVDAEEQLKLERTEAEKALSTPGGVNGCNGFVTFSDPASAEIAMSMQYGTDAAVWVVSLPGPAESVLWKDLEQDPGRKTFWSLFGVLLTAGLYMLYLPLTIWITTISGKIDMGPLQPVWEGLAPTMGLLVMVSFLPTFLILIFRACFTLNDDAYSQYVLQQWYFVFQVVFVILITAIGDSLFLFMKTLVMTPLEVMPILAKTMPGATHFFMNFLMLAWAAHGTNFTRSVPLMKFLFFRKIFEEEKARQMAEPEDQDYYGLGSRHARFAIMMCISIIFGTMSPPIPLLGFVNFFLCRLVYGYLAPFAEQKKPDLGGLFFVRACRHLFIGNIIYVLLMTGVLYDRATSGIPATVSIAAMFYVIWSMQRFETEFLYEKLPFEEHIKKGTDTKHRGEGAPYVQPEWKK